MIIGGGKTGFYLAEKLSEFGAAVKLVEKSKARCHYLSTHLNNVMVLHSDGTDISLLEEENMNEMDAFVTATGYDEENLLLALTAKQHGIADVISKVSHESYKGLIERMGVDVVLNPLDITASNILRFIQGSKENHFFPFDSGTSRNYGNHRSFSYDHDWRPTCRTGTSRWRTYRCHSQRTRRDHSIWKNKNRTARQSHHTQLAQRNWRLGKTIKE